MQKLFYSHSFGSPMPSRSFSASSYKYGFNGKEKDDEVKGGGNSLDFGMRIYDSRLGRWSTIDPYYREYTSISPYSFALNKPIIYVDSDGEKIWDPKSGEEVTVTWDTENKPTFVTAGGKPVSDQFMRKAGPLLYNLSTSQVGRDLVVKMQTLETKIELNSPSNGDGRGRASGVDPDVKKNGAPKLTKSGLYKHVNIKLNENFIRNKAAVNNVDYNEVLVGVMTVEVGHLSSAAQIKNDQALIDDGYGRSIQTDTRYEDPKAHIGKIENRQHLAKEAYENIMNQASDAQINYRVEKGQEVNKSVFMILNGVKVKQPLTFDKVEIKPSTKEHYEKSGGKE
jgi:RHS repeat-associated protein